MRIGGVYDVGQRINTPKGTAIVLSSRLISNCVRTDLGAFTVEHTSAYLDRDSITESVDSLEAWLDAPEPAAEFGERVEARSIPCVCDWGSTPGPCCHHLVHVSESGEILTRFPHTAITSNCRCVMRECQCVNH